MSLLDKLFVSLRVLSKLPEGGRICTTGTGQIKIEDTDTFGGWIATGRRRLTGDSRDEAVKVLMQVINEVGERSDLEIESIRNYPSGSNTSYAQQFETAKKCHTLEKICNMLKSAKKGIVNLHGTYSDDANITAKLEEIMEKMDSQQMRISEVVARVRSAPRVVEMPPPPAGGVAARSPVTAESPRYLPPSLAISPSSREEAPLRRPAAPTDDSSDDEEIPYDPFEND